MQPADGPVYWLGSMSADDGIGSLNSGLVRLLASWAEATDLSDVAEMIDLPRAKLAFLLGATAPGHEDSPVPAHHSLCLFTVNSQSSFGAPEFVCCLPPSLQPLATVLQVLFLSQVSLCAFVSPLAVRTRFAVPLSFCRRVASSERGAWDRWSSEGFRLRARSGLFVDPARPEVRDSVLTAAALAAERKRFVR